jgi:hypothetical protein
MAVGKSRAAAMANVGSERGAVMTRREVGLLIAGGYLYLAVLGFLTGIVVERIRFDRQRATLLQHFAATHERLRTRLMDLERQTESSRRRHER